MCGWVHRTDIGAVCVERGGLANVDEKNVESHTHKPTEKLILRGALELTGPMVYMKTYIFNHFY